METIEPHYSIINPKNFQPMERKTIKSIFSFYIPYQLLLPPEEEFPIRLPKNPEKLHTLKVISRVAYTLNHNHIFFGYEDLSQIDGFNQVLVRNGDRFGITGYNEISITYDRFVDLSDEQGKINFSKLNDALEKVCELYNYFLDVYAAIVRHRQVMKISPQDIHTLNFSHYDTIENINYNNFKITAVHGATMLGGFISPPKEVITRMKELLESGNSNLHLCGLGINAIRNLFGGDYLASIVQAITQLESFIYTVYQVKLKNKNINEMDKILGRLGLSNLLEMMALILNEKEYTDLKEMIDFEKVKKAINARNKFIHEGKDSIGISSLNKAEEYIDEVNRLCVELGKIAGVDHTLNKEKSGWNI